MEPTRDTNATLVDLLDRILDKGLLLNADVIIHVAGVPLLGINLRAALAGMETMLDYGMWQDWDEAQRAAATEEQHKTKHMPLKAGEKVLLKVFASCWHKDDLYGIWKPGHLYITDRRLFLFREHPAEMLLQCPYEDIRSVTTATETDAAGGQVHSLNLLLKSEGTIYLHSINASGVKDAIKQGMQGLGLSLQENSPLEERCLIWR